MQAEQLTSLPRLPGELRILVLPPTHADGMAIGKVLSEAAINCTVVADVEMLCAALAGGAGAVILSEEALLVDAPSVEVAVTVKSNDPLKSAGGVIVKPGRSSGVSSHAPSPKSVPADNVAPSGTPYGYRKTSSRLLWFIRAIS